MVRVLNASFLISVPKIELAPSFGLSEVAFLGRSNVGKSSLINALVNQKALAKSSSTPGKTQLINFFKVGLEKKENTDEPSQRAELVFVDLPGFGYAKVSKDLQRQWQKHLDEFLRFRADIRLFIQLIDSRHTGLEIDENLSQYLASFIRPDQAVLRVYTKLDKLNQKEISALKKFDPNGIFVSAAKKQGTDRLLSAILAASLGAL